MSLVPPPRSPVPTPQSLLPNPLSPIPIPYFLLGWLSGVFVNLLADTLPVTRRVWPPVCPRCETAQSWRGALGLARVYGACGHPRSLRSWVLPPAGAAGALLLWLYPPARFGFWAAWAILTYFAVVVVIDTEHRLILHPVSWAGAALGVALGVWRHGLGSTLLGGAVGYAVMLGLYAFGGFFARWVARRRGEPLDEVALGFGDVNLAGVTGLFLGWPGVAAGLILAILLGGVVSGGYLLWMAARRRYRAFAAIPYGPFLALAAVWLLLWA